MAGPKMTDKIYHYVVEIEEDGKLNLQNKVDKLSSIRESIVKYGSNRCQIFRLFIFYKVDKGLSKSKVTLRFAESDENKSRKFQQIINDIEKLKDEYIISGGTDMDYIKNLENLEYFYLKVKQQISGEPAIKDYLNTTRSFYHQANPNFNDTDNPNIILNTLDQSSKMILYQILMNNF